MSRSDERRHVNRNERREIKQILSDTEDAKHLEGFVTEKKFYKLKQTLED
jgi:hypothetical protein